MPSFLYLGDANSHIGVVSITGNLDSDIGDCLIGGSQQYVTGMAWDPTTDTLYGVTGNAGTQPNKLIIIDPDTAVATVVGSLGAAALNRCTDISINSSGQIYGWQSSVNPGGLLSINKSTGASSVVGYQLAFWAGGGIAFDGSDVLWRVPAVGGTNDRNKLATIDTATGNPTYIGIFSGSGSSGDLANAATFHNGVLYFANGNNNDDVYSVNTSTAAIAVAFTSPSPLYGNFIDSIASVVTVVPPPANDDYADAELITGASGSVDGTTDGATADWPDAGSEVNVWYKWTAPRTGTFRFAGHTTAIFQGSTRIVTGNPSIFLATEGVQYHIAVYDA